MPVESFYGWASDPHIRPVPGTEGSRPILSCTKSRTLTTLSKKSIRTVPFPPLEALRRGRRDDLDAHGAGRVSCRGVNRMRVHSVDESGGVVQVEGAGACYTLSAENGHGKLLA